MTFNHHLSEQALLCDALESIADSLPVNVDTQFCLQVARRLYPTVKQAHEFEENQLFPALEKSARRAEVKVTLERLRGEHWEDESYAMEVQEALTEFVMGPERFHHDALGYMLRGFFEGLRRHIAFEKEYLLPILNTDSGKTD
jgi:iron-sulfur cluster repair protein YtfE (RIC family)